jgi:hypothetical protein
MNFYIIILTVIVIILVYLLYRFFSNSGKSLASNVYLKNVNNTPIAMSNSSTRYAYGLWIYVNSLAPTNPTMIISRCNSVPNYSNATKLPTNSSMALYLDNTSTLKLDISQSCAAETSATSAISITTNFPFQKWCYVMFCTDGQYVDCYIDGKLVKSVVLNCLIKGPDTTTDNVYLGGNSISDINIAKLQYWSHPLSPQEVWSNYLRGNGTNMLSNLFASYGFGVSLFKNNVEVSNTRVF